VVQYSKHVIPPAVTANLTNQLAHDLGVELSAVPPRVLTDWRFGNHLHPSQDEDDRPPLASIAQRWGMRP